LQLSQNSLVKHGTFVCLKDAAHHDLSGVMLCLNVRILV
jgi:hypothetical protein